MPRFRMSISSRVVKLGEPVSICDGNDSAGFGAVLFGLVDSTELGGLELPTEGFMANRVSGKLSGVLGVESVSAFALGKSRLGLA